jgi:hypothetical protein
MGEEDFNESEVDYREVLIFDVFIVMPVYCLTKYRSGLYSSYLCEDYEYDSYHRSFWHCGGVY